MPSHSDANCIFCNPDSATHQYVLHETPTFRVVCDTYALTEGHLLIIPKQHVSCIGVYPRRLFQEFLTLYVQFSSFILTQYGGVSTFEHGVFGQTVFHSHVHILPYRGKPQDILPEGERYYEKAKLEDLPAELKRSSGYLFFSIGSEAWLVDATLREPRFFRDRFARALHAAERMDWKVARTNPQLMGQFQKENQRVLDRWSAAKNA